MLNPLLLPPRLLLRALDDLNALADAARRLPELERRALERAESLQGELTAMREGLAELLGRVEAIERTIEPVDEDIRQVVRNVEPLDDGIRAVGRAVDPLDDQLAGAREELTALRGTMDEQLGGMRADLGGLQRSLDRLQGELSGVSEVVEPLQSAAARIDRLTDRLPGV